MFKKLRVSLMFLFILSITFVLPNKTLAFNPPTNQVVNSKKLWTVKFTKEFTYDDVTKKGITVKDSSNNLIDVTFDVGQDKKTLLINPPLGGYTSGEKYTLNLSQDVHSQDKKLPKNINIPFTISTDTIPIPKKEVNIEAKPGDIVGIDSNFQAYPYCHYGIYIGDNKVIHYSSNGGSIQNAEIRVGDMDASFPKGKYFVLDFSGSANYSADDIIKRAQSRLGEKSYDLINNNCEHFAVWCKTNNSESYQIDSLSKTQIQMLKQFTATGIIPD